MQIQSNRKEVKYSFTAMLASQDLPQSALPTLWSRWPVIWHMLMTLWSRSVLAYRQTWTLWDSFWSSKSSYIQLRRGIPILSQALICITELPATILKQVYPVLHMPTLIINPSVLHQLFLCCLHLDTPLLSAVEAQPWLLVQLSYSPPVSVCLLHPSVYSRINCLVDTNFSSRNPTEQEYYRLCSLVPVE